MYLSDLTFSYLWSRRALLFGANVEDEQLVGLCCPLSLVHFETSNFHCHYASKSFLTVGERRDAKHTRQALHDTVGVNYINRRLVGCDPSKCGRSNRDILAWEQEQVYNMPALLNLIFETKLTLKWTWNWHNGIIPVTWPLFMSGEPILLIFFAMDCFTDVR